MPLAHVAIDSSQFPEAVRRDLLVSLRSRKINHKFHYDSFKQTQKWLALHEAYSPARTDPNCAGIYIEGFAAAVRRLHSSRIHLIGLGCGGGQKDAALMQVLQDAGKEVSYTPSDVSTAMVLVARQTASRVVAEAHCFPVVCDLATAEGLGDIFSRPGGGAEEGGAKDVPGARGAAKIFTFFGMLPNFEPELILPKLAGLVQPGDCLVLSANLAPGTDYAAGVQRVLPLYDNALTRDWLMTFLWDLGVEKGDGELRFGIEETGGAVSLRRIRADFRFVRERILEVEAERFEFRAGESVRLFFSYRHTPELVRELAEQYGLRVIDQWVTPSQEEGVFLAQRV